ncbi:MAG: hypothetical protein ABL899_02340 [Nitrospira sp.]
MENINKKNKIWFRAKNYGWGWYPVSWQGWVIIILYLIGTVQYFLNADMFSHSVSDTLLRFSVPFVINTIFLLIICYAHGEKPRWRWGEK